MEALDLYETDDVEAQLKAMREGAEIDAERLAKMMLADHRNDEATLAAVKAEVDRITERAEIVQRRIEWRRREMLDVLRQGDLKSVKDPVLGNVTRKPCNPSVDVLDMAKLPDKWIKVGEPEVSADKKAILEYFKASGEIPDGVEIILDKETIAITG